MITIALPKGRLAQETADFFEKCGLLNIKMEEDSRKLIFIDEVNNLRIILVKPFDVPTYVEYGAADMGVVGKDVIMEKNVNIFEILDMGIGRCFLALAGVKGKKEDFIRKKDKVIATKYPEVTREYFEKINHQSLKVIRLNGSVELAPLLGLADGIVDVVETGRTLKENGLEVYEKLFDISARLIINRASLKMKKDLINDIVERIERGLEIEGAICPKS
ncbi:ATP phosphoribosyltransferase [Thermovenabulum gondwanense]|uniref:ATP phosphoribosyltransferase n=1 Tax=Thermovenabulum gondwanense TaxID=520767 RepID=A0A161PVA1_9FIRM|nr:ATP phosphoribosyltransferase [Thermovenabulum gondwanense]KYO64326.1 ATP phosphoribosyltransferase [Thermovenabulum gondwanense]